MEITIAHCDDWLALYKDGKKVYENHSCSLKEGLRYLGIEYEDMNLEAFDEQISERGDYFPETLSEMNAWLDHLGGET